MARPQPFKIEPPKGAEPALARQMEGIEQNFRTLFIDAKTAEDTLSDAIDDLSASVTAAIAAAVPSLTEWDTIIVASAVQNVENSSTLVDHTELQFPVTAGDHWKFEMDVYYSATDATRDIVWDIAASVGNMTGWAHHTGLGTGNAGTDTTVALVGVATSTDVINGTETGDAIRPLHILAMIRFDGTGVCSFRFAQSSASVGTFTRVEAGSRLRAKLLI